MAKIKSRQDFARMVADYKRAGLTRDDALEDAHKDGYLVQGVEPVDVGQRSAKMIGDALPFIGGLAGAGVVAPGGLLAAAPTAGLGTIGIEAAGAGLGGWAGSVGRDLLYSASGMDQPEPTAGAKLVRQFLPEDTSHLIDSPVEGVMQGAYQAVGGAAQKYAIEPAAATTINALNGFRKSLKYNPGLTMIQEGIRRHGLPFIKGGRQQIAKVVQGIIPELKQHLQNSTNVIDFKGVLQDAKTKFMQFYGNKSATPEQAEKVADRFIKVLENDKANPTAMSMDRAYTVAQDLGHRSASIWEATAWGRQPPRVGSVAEARKEFMATVSQTMKENVRTKVPEVGPIDERLSKLLNLDDELLMNEQSSLLTRTLGEARRHTPALVGAGIGFSQGQDAESKARLAGLGFLGVESLSSPTAWRLLSHALANAPRGADYLGTTRQ